MRIRAYAKGLQELGVSVEVWAGYSSSFNKEGYNTQAKGTWKGIPYRILGGTALYQNTRPGKFWVWLKANLTLLLLLRKNRHQNTHWIAYMPEPSGLWLAIYLAARIWEMRFAFIETELFSLITDVNDRRFYERLEAKKKQVASKILVITPELEQAYGAMDGIAQILRITPIVAELDELLLIRCQHVNTLGYIGTFGEKDGVNTMLHAFESARKQMPELSFLLSGKADHLPESLPQGATYTGPFSANELFERMQSCDTLILNRRDNAYARHGFPIKLAEYTASGIPVLLCDFPFYREFFSDDEVWYFKPDDAYDLCRAIFDRYAQPEKAKRMSKNARLKCMRLFSPVAAAKDLGDKLCIHKMD